MGSGVQLPERADLEALPATDRSGCTPGGYGVSQVVGDGPPANGGWIDLKIEAAMNLGSGKTVGSRRTSRKEFAHEGFDALGPIGGMITTGMAGTP